MAAAVAEMAGVEMVAAAAEMAGVEMAEEAAEMAGVEMAAEAAEMATPPPARECIDHTEHKLRWQEGRPSCHLCLGCSNSYLLRWVHRTSRVPSQHQTHCCLPGKQAWEGLAQRKPLLIGLTHTCCTRCRLASPRGQTWSPSGNMHGSPPATRRWGKGPIRRSKSRCCLGRPAVSRSLCRSPR